mmetsp:Transcript_18516/g.44380  ORF Transcript_18516/g.44380 Transcript_18516/m.44380 type:complete len:238 (-) Transcript_18516:2-715(-)
MSGTDITMWVVMTTKIPRPLPRPPHLPRPRDRPCGPCPPRTETSHNAASSSPRTSSSTPTSPPSSTPSSSTSAASRVCISTFKTASAPPLSSSTPSPQAFSVSSPSAVPNSRHCASSPTLSTSFSSSWALRGDKGQSTSLRGPSWGRSPRSKHRSTGGQRTRRASRNGVRASKGLWSHSERQRVRRIMPLNRHGRWEQQELTLCLDRQTNALLAPCTLQITTSTTLSIFFCHSINET